MEQVIFERPREKLQRYGVSILTNAELLQVVIGSGSSRVPVANIARNVNKRLDTQGALSYKKLMEVEGVGMANALRVIAALELGRRLSLPKSNPSVLDMTLVRKSRLRSIAYETVDGNAKVIATQFHLVNARQASSLLARQICAKVLSDNAWGVNIAIGYSKAPRQPGMYELAFVADIKELTRRLQINLMSVEYVTKAESVSLYKVAQ